MGAGQCARPSLARGDRSHRARPRHWRWQRRGIGYSLPSSIGAALGHKGSGRLCVNIIGDGDFLMRSNALWTAAKYQIPLLVVVLNNRPYYNDEDH